MSGERSDVEPRVGSKRHIPGAGAELSAPLGVPDTSGTRSGQAFGACTEH
jgi:hypothetical protein